MMRVIGVCAAVVMIAACGSNTGSGAGGGSGGGAATGGGSGSGGGKATGGGTGTGGGAATGGGSGIGGGAAAGGGSGVGGGSGAGGGSGVGGGTGMASCTWSVDAGTPCGSNQYCDAPGCGVGTCVAIPVAQTANKNPVCGCNGLDYWNASVAASGGMAVKAAGVCATAVFCGGFAGIQCPTGASCGYRVESASECNVSDASGKCWVLPKTCVAPAIGPVTRACGSVSCTDECNLNKLGVTWYPDSTCPK